MKDEIKEIKEIKVNKANKSITIINNGIAFSQFGVADEILDLIINLQERIEKTIKLLKEAGCYEEDTKIFCSDIYQELPELLNILQGEDKDDNR